MVQEVLPCSHCVTGTGTAWKSGGKQAQKDCPWSPSYSPSPVPSSSGSRHPSPAILHQETLLGAKNLLGRWLMLPETNCSWDEQNFTTRTNGKGRVGSEAVGEINGNYWWFLSKLVLTGGKWSYYSSQQENLEENRWKERPQSFAVQEGEEVIIFAPQITFSKFTNTKEQEGIEALFHPQWNKNSYDQRNPLFPLKVTNAIFCRWLSENVKGCEKSHAARQLLTEYMSEEALEWELLKEVI